MTARRILVLGAPRAGTTWVAEVLGAHPHLEYVHEPDNEKISLLAQIGKRHLDRFPRLEPGAEHGALAALWCAAFDRRAGRWWSTARLARALAGPSWRSERLIARKEGHPATPAGLRFGANLIRALTALGGHTARGRVVKTVHAALCAEWVARTVAPDAVVVALRSPYGVLASLKRMHMPDAVRAGTIRPEVQEACLGRVVASPDASYLTKATAQLALLYRALLAAHAKNPAWVLVRHEALCLAPQVEFAGLVRAVGLPANEAISSIVAQRDRPASGYTAARVAADEVGKWRRELATEDVEAISLALDASGLTDWVETA